MTYPTVMNPYLSRYLDTDGDGGGTKNANGDYSSTADIFYIQPGAGEIYDIHRLIISVEDTNGFTAEEYGNLGAALSNGVIVRVSDDSGVINNLTDDLPIKANAAWGELCYDVDLKTWGAGNEFLLVRWTFTKGGVPIRLRGNKNERLEVVLNDDLSGLVSHYFLVQGNKKL